MKKRLIITQKQYDTLRENVRSTQEVVIDEMKKELSANYSIEPTLVRGNGDYSKKPMFKVLADEQYITSADVFKYLNEKYGSQYQISNPTFIEQIIRDWVDGDKSNVLTKLVNMN